MTVDNEIYLMRVLLSELLQTEETLLDKFATAALPLAWSVSAAVNRDTTYQFVAKIAYNMAEAMMKEKGERLAILDQQALARSSQGNQDLG